MSVVLTAILVIDGDCEAFDDNQTWPIHVTIKAWTRAQAGCGMSPVIFGGGSAGQVKCFSIATKRFNSEEFAEFLRSLPWTPAVPGKIMGDIVQLIANDEHDAGVKIIHIFGDTEQRK